MQTLASDQIEEIRRQANLIRRRSLRMVHRARMGHPGGDFSSADILSVLYFGVLRVDPARAAAPDRDRFIMSKGHCSGALYAVLAAAGFFPLEQLESYMAPLSPLNGHPDRNKVPGVEACTGALGHGLPIAAGAALGARIQGAGWRTFVLTGDGELQEGSNWEAAMSAAHYGLDNLTLVIDRNRFQQGDATEAAMRLEPLADKWRAFGWSVAEVDGHDHGALFQQFQALPLEAGKPNCIIAHTVKGKGVGFMEDRVEWHHKVPSSEQLEAALRELGEASP
ncbi:MAG: transketolase [Bryobacteraceae bacterium]|nr:transketolase [Bryobacteraceae bacterium]